MRLPASDHRRLVGLVCLFGVVALGQRPAVAQVAGEGSAVAANLFSGFGANYSGGGSAVCAAGAAPDGYDFCATDFPYAPAAGTALAPVACTELQVPVSSDVAGVTLDVNQFCAIMRGDITNWSEVGLPDEAITVVSETRGSDLAGAVANVCGQVIAGVVAGSSAAAVVNKVAMLNGAIGYADQGNVSGAGLSSACQVAAPLYALYDSSNTSASDFVATIVANPGVVDSLGYLSLDECGADQLNNSITGPPSITVGTAAVQFTANVYETFDAGHRGSSYQWSLVGTGGINCAAGGNPCGTISIPAPQGGSTGSIQNGIWSPAISLPANNTATVAWTPPVHQPGAGNVVTLVLKTTCDHGGAGTNSLAVTLAAPPVVCSGGTVSCGATAAVTYNGIALTKAGSSINGSVRAEVWYLKAPPSGAHNVVVTSGATSAVMAASVSFTGVDQSTPLGTFVSASGRGTTSSVTASSTSGEAVVDVVGALGSTAPTVGPLQVARQTNNSTGSGNLAIPDVVLGTSTRFGTPSAPMSWDFALNDWVSAAVNIRPATALTAVGLISLTATLEASDVRLTWQMGYNPEELGFDVFRQTAAGRTQLNATLIDGNVLMPSGSAVHQYRDSANGWGTAAVYWLRVSMLDGTTSWYGPVAVTSQPQVVSPVSPATFAARHAIGCGMSSGAPAGAMLLVMVAGTIALLLRRGKRNWFLIGFVAASFAFANVMFVRGASAAGGVTYDTSATGVAYTNGTSSPTLTFAHTMGAGSSGLLVVVVVMPVACDDLTADAANCGACGNVCVPPAHATGVCTASTCGFSCKLGWLDLDGNPANGCEAPAFEASANLRMAPLLACFGSLQATVVPAAGSSGAPTPPYYAAFVSIPFGAAYGYTQVKIANERLGLPVNLGTTDTGLSVDDACAVITGAQTAWSNGTPITVVAQSAGSGNGSPFAVWQACGDDGTNTSGAIVVDNDADVISTVSSIPGAIGYASLALVAQGPVANGIATPIQEAIYAIYDADANIDGVGDYIDSIISDPGHVTSCGYDPP